MRNQRHPAADRRHGRRRDHDRNQTLGPVDQPRLRPENAGWQETEAALANMVQAARQMRTGSFQQQVSAVSN